MTDVYYRYEDFLQSSGGIDMCGEWEPGPSVLRVRVMQFDVVKKTPKGAWINGNGGKQFIADRWFNKFANPTLEGARQDFLARKRRLIAIQKRRIRDARLAIATAKKNQPEHGGLLGEQLGYLKRVHAWEVELMK